MAAETFNLSWNDFDTCTRKTFQNLISDQDFTDVTLACVDNKQLKAHKVILSACSPFFKSLFLSNPHQHPIIYLKGVNFSDLLCIIQFIYLGQTRVEHSRLENFMITAKELEIQGLITDSNSKGSNQDTQNICPKQIRQEQDNWNNGDDYEIQAPNMEDDANLPNSVFNDDEVDLHNNYHAPTYNTFTNNYGLPDTKPQQFVMKRTTGHEKRHACDQCDYRGLTPQHVREHKMSIHEGIKFSCDLCDKVYSHPNNLRTHKKAKH